MTDVTDDNPMTNLHYACPLCDWTADSADYTDEVGWSIACGEHSRHAHDVAEWVREVARLREAAERVLDAWNDGRGRITPFTAALDALRDAMTEENDR